MSGGRRRCSCRRCRRLLLLYLGEAVEIVVDPDAVADVEEVVARVRGRLRSVLLLLL